MRKLIGLLAAFLLVVASCGSGDEATDSADAGGDFTQTTQAAMQESDSAGDGDAMEAPASDNDAGVIDAGSNSGLGGGAAAPVVNAQDVPLQPIDIGRDIIYTATIEVAVDNLGTASQLALTQIEGMGGLLFGQTTTTQGIPVTVLTFKVSPQDFQAALRALGEVGEIRDQNISTTDVTERVVDLQSQIITSEAGVERLRGFLENATTLEQIAQFERELLDRETILERLRGQLRTVQAQVALATITVTMTEIVPGPALTLTETVYLGHDSGATCGGDASVRVDEGEPITICLAVTNTGDTFLTGIEIREEALKLKTADFTLLDGSLEALLAPESSLTLFYEGTASKSLNGQAQATARPVDETGSAVIQGTVAGRSSASISVSPDNSLPGFTAGFESGWATLVTVISAVVLSLGFLLPIIPLLALAWFAVRLARRRVGARSAKPATFTPPPPQPTREPVGAES